MEHTLNIPMSASPTRQTFWRVVRVVGTMFAAWSIVTGAHRLLFGFSAIVPPNDVIAIRIPKNDRVITDLRALTKGMNVVPGVPISLADALNATDRTLNVWFMENGNVTMILDRTIDDSETKALESFGATVVRHESLTIISNNTSTTPITRNLFHNLLPTLLSGASATLSLGESRTDISIEPESMTFHDTAFLHAPNIDEPATAATVFSASVPSSGIQSLIQQAFTQNTPGIFSLFTIAEKNGVSAHIDRDSDSTSYTLVFALTPETQFLASEESLTHIAKELVEIPTIDGITTFLSDGSKVTTLRSREEASVLVRDETPYRFITATSSFGTVYITQTPTFLSVSNHIQSATPSSAYSTSCLSGAVAFIQPTKLFSSLQVQTYYQPSLLSNILWHAHELASTPSTSRICIDK